MKPIPLSLQGRYIVEAAAGHAFVKIRASRQSVEIGHFRRQFDRENECLRKLRGLAVPRLVPISRRDLPIAFRDLPATYVATEVLAEHGPIDAIGLDPEALVAGWLFVVEQLVAFRRREILYSDIRCTNVLASKEPFEARIVDLEGCSPLVPPGKPLVNYGYTVRLEPPELSRGYAFTERSVVYQVAQLLPHILRHRMKQAVIGNTSPRWKGVLVSRGVGDLVSLAVRGTAPEPRHRFGTLEALHRAARSVSLPDSIAGLLAQLRAPYARALARLDLTWERR
jgi:hypothetical protein